MPDPRRAALDDILKRGRRITDEEAMGTGAGHDLPWKEPLDDFQKWMNDRTKDGYSNMDLPNAVLNAIPRTTDDAYSAALPPWTKVKGNPDVVDIGRAKAALAGETPADIDIKRRLKQEQANFNKAQSKLDTKNENKRQGADLLAALKERETLKESFVREPPNTQEFRDLIWGTEYAINNAKSMDDEVNALSKLGELVDYGNKAKSDLKLSGDFFDRMREKYGIIPRDE